MEVTATTPESKHELLKHFRVHDENPVAMAQIITSPEPFTVTKEPAKGGSRAWFLCSSALDLEWTQPYFNELHRRTGYVGRGILPDLTPEYLTPRYKWAGLCFSHYVKSVSLQHGHFCFEVIVSSEDWNGRKAEDRCDSYAANGVQSELGDTRREPEFIPTGFGSNMKHNPNYLKQHPPHPAFTSSWFWCALVDWWVENEATPPQRQFVEASGVLMGKLLVNGVSDLHNMRKEHSIRTSWEWDGLGWDEFSKL